jgi:hypothetical protein
LDKITLIFVGGDSTVDRVIEKVSGGDVSHVACLLFDSVYESTGLKEEEDPYPGVWLHNPHKYCKNPYAKFIRINVPDKEGLNKMARRLLGTPYSYAGCIKTGIFDILGIDLPDTDYTMHCSETITRLLRSGGVNVLPEVEPSSIDPSRLYKAILSIKGDDINGQSVDS